MMRLTLGCVFMLYALCLLVCSGYGAEIINGKEVKPHSMPFMALLLKNNFPVCGGILISPQWVLTAAHCCGITAVALGVHNIKKRETILAVTRQRIHDDYDPQKKLNDFMLLKLSKPVKETKTVKILPVSNSVDPAAGSICVVAGWGKTKNQAKKGSDVLMSVNVTVIDRAKCNSRDYYNNKPTITSGHICAGSDVTNVADTCDGDSGGPLLCEEKLVGVTSFGKQCGLINNPGVYGFLSKTIVQWIKKTIKKTSF